MSFVNPIFFWVMFIPLILFSYLILTHKDNFLQVFDEEVLKRLSVGDDSLPLVWRNLLLILSIFFMIVAMARPVIDHGDKVVQLEGLSAVVALDISGSMRSQDIYPNRLEFAKKKMMTLFDSMPTDELAILGFAHSTFAIAPFSSDKATLKQIVDGVSDEYINMASTDFRALANFSAELLKEKKTKILILFSDGGDKKDIAEFREIIKDKNIALYVVLVGTKEGAPVLDDQGKPVNYQGKIAITQRNDALGDVAIENSGAFMIATTGDEGIKKLVSIIKSNHQNKEQGEVIIHDREEYFYYPIGLAIFFLFLGFISLPSRKWS
ncbi:MAG TPA: VWA domain-containing protein [Campylobacterales bacterium]|nr:VWA domain-containing protein [Campylobacterales bacterium]